MQPLPQGLDPVRAGRFGLWLLGKRSHAAGLRRRGIVLRVGGKTKLRRYSNLLLPWRLYEYPGTLRYLSELLNVSTRSIGRWLSSDDQLPAKHAKRLALICRERAAMFEALAKEFDEHQRLRKRIGRIRSSKRGG